MKAIQTHRKEQHPNAWVLKGRKSPRHLLSSVHGTKKQEFKLAPSKRQGINIVVTSTSTSNKQQRLLKTEMCRNMELHGKCVHGNSCDFAHYEYELCSRTFSGRSANGMIPSSHTNIHEYLARPCVDFVATGSW